MDLKEQIECVLRLYLDRTKHKLVVDSVMNALSSLIEERDKQRAEIDALKQAIRKQLAEIDAMKDRAPVAKVETWTNGSYSRHYKIVWIRDVDEGAMLYALPGAQGEEK